MRTKKCPEKKTLDLFSRLREIYFVEKKIRSTPVGSHAIAALILDERSATGPTIRKVSGDSILLFLRFGRAAGAKKNRNVDSTDHFLVDSFAPILAASLANRANGDARAHPRWQTKTPFIGASPGCFARRSPGRSTRNGARSFALAFIGQIALSFGFIIYSWRSQNWVLVVTNSAMLLTAIAGQIIQIRNGKLTN